MIFNNQESARKFKFVVLLLLTLIFKSFVKLQNNVIHCFCCLEAKEDPTCEQSIHVVIYNPFIILEICREIDESFKDFRSSKNSEMYRTLRLFTIGFQFLPHGDNKPKLVYLKQSSCLDIDLILIVSLIALNTLLARRI